MSTHSLDPGPACGLTVDVALERHGQSALWITAAKVDSAQRPAQEASLFGSQWFCGSLNQRLEAVKSG
jgi:hypothetical protein